YVSFTSPDPPEIPPLSLHDALPILRRKFLTSGQNVGDWPSPSRTPGAVPVVLAAAGVVLAVLAVLGSPSSNQAPSAPILPAVGAKPTEQPSPSSSPTQQPSVAPSP